MQEDKYPSFFRNKTRKNVSNLETEDFIMTAKFTNPLNTIKVASPCSANWDEMVGNNRQRFCGQCKLNVYNLSGMTKREAEDLIMNSEGRLCARFFRRSDGTVLTKDCPVGWKAVKRRMSKVWTAFASVVITAISGIGITAFMNQTTEDYGATTGVIAIENPNNNPEPEMGEIPVEINEEPVELMGDIDISSIKDDKHVMGKIAIPQK